MCEESKFGHEVAEEFELITPQIVDVFKFARKLVGTVVNLLFGICLTSL